MKLCVLYCRLKLPHFSKIRQILRNEKYAGDALLQKTYTIDPISGSRKKNDGELAQYLVKIAIPLSFPVRHLRLFRKRWRGAPRRKPRKSFRNRHRKRRFTPANMHCLESRFAERVILPITAVHGKETEKLVSYGAVKIGLKMEKVLHKLSNDSRT